MSNRKSTKPDGAQSLNLRRSSRLRATAANAGLDLNTENASAAAASKPHPGTSRAPITATATDPRNIESVRSSSNAGQDRQAIHLGAESEKEKDALQAIQERKAGETRHSSAIPEKYKDHLFKEGMHLVSVDVPPAPRQGYELVRIDHGKRAFWYHERKRYDSLFNSPELQSPESKVRTESTQPSHEALPKRWAQPTQLPVPRQSSSSGLPVILKLPTDSTESTHADDLDPTSSGISNRDQLQPPPSFPSMAASSSNNNSSSSSSSAFASASAYPSGLLPYDFGASPLYPPAQTTQPTTSSAQPQSSSAQTSHPILPMARKVQTTRSPPTQLPAEAAQSAKRSRQASFQAFLRDEIRREMANIQAGAAVGIRLEIRIPMQGDMEDRYCARYDLPPTPEAIPLRDIRIGRYETVESILAEQVRVSEKRKTWKRAGGVLGKSTGGVVKRRA